MLRILVTQCSRQQVAINGLPFVHTGVSLYSSVVIPLKQVPKMNISFCLSTANTSPHIKCEIISNTLGNLVTITSPLLGSTAIIFIFLAFARWKTLIKQKFNRFKLKPLALEVKQQKYNASYYGSTQESGHFQTRIYLMRLKILE